MPYSSFQYVYVSFIVLSACKIGASCHMNFTVKTMWNIHKNAVAIITLLTLLWRRTKIDVKYLFTTPLYEVSKIDSLFCWKFNFVWKQEKNLLGIIDSFSVEMSLSWNFPA